MDSSSFLKQNALGVGSQFVSFASNLVFNIALPIFLGAVVFGKLSISLGFAYLLVGLFDFGFNNSCIRFISKYNAEKERGKLASSFWRLFKMKTAVAFVLSVALFASSFWLAGVYSVSALSIQLASVLIVLSSSVSFLIAFFTAVSRNDVSLKATVLNSSLLVILPISAYFAGFMHAGVVAGVDAAFLITVVYLLFAAFAHLRKSGAKQKEVGVDLTRSVFGFSSVSFANIFLIWGVLLVLGLFAPSDSVAFFKVSLSWILAVSSLVPVSSSVVFSYFMNVRSTNPLKLFSYVRRTVRYSMIILVPAMFGLFFVGPKAVSVIYGPSYAQAGVALTLMCWALLPYFLNSLLLSALASLGKLREISKAYASSLAVGVILAFALSHYFGLEGAVVSFVIVNYLIMFLSVIVLNQKKASAGLSSAIKPVVASAVMSGFVYYFLDGVSSVLSGVILVFAAALVYFAFLFVVRGIDKNDLRLIKRIAE